MSDYYGDTCSGYYDTWGPDTCGWSDTLEFIAEDACCACKGSDDDWDFGEYDPAMDAAGEYDYLYEYYEEVMGEPLDQES